MSVHTLWTLGKLLNGVTPACVGMVARCHTTYPRSLHPCAPFVSLRVPRDVSFNALTGIIPSTLAAVVTAAGSNGNFRFQNNTAGLSPSIQLVQACNTQHTCK